MITRGVRNVLIAWLLLTGIASAAENLWGLTTDQKLVRFSSSAPGTLLASLPITGLPDGEHLVAIEVPEHQGIFVGVSNAGRYYALDRLTGVATALNPAAPGTPLTGTAFGIGNLDVVSNDGSSIRAGLDGWSGPGPTLTQPAHMVAWALSSTALAVNAMVDSHTDALYRPSFGPDPQALIGSLNVDTSDEAGLDAGAREAKLYAALTVNGTPGLYTIDPTTGTRRSSVQSRPRRSRRWPSICRACRDWNPRCPPWSKATPQ